MRSKFVVCQAPKPAPRSKRKRREFIGGPYGRRVPRKMTVTGGFFVPQHAEFLPVLKSELLSFPAGKHDDIVDALGLIGQILDRMSPGRPLEPEKPRPKVLSFEPGKTTLTLTELFEENERRYKRSSYQRI